MRIYFDANLIGVARRIAVNDSRVVFPGHPDWPFAQAEDDEVWLQYIGDSGWCAIFRDKRIRYRPTERRALERHLVRAIVLATKQNLTTAENVALLEAHWQLVEEVLLAPPALYHLTRSGLTSKVVY